MIIIEPSAELLHITPNAAEHIERVARTCYKSEDQILPGSAAKLVSMLMQRGHHAMLEFGEATFRFITDRGVTHEMVRHRMSSYAQESTRYCNYGKDKFYAQISVIEPPCKTDKGLDYWTCAMQDAEKWYMGMLTAGESPQIARSVLPNSLKTEIIMKANFREWLHVFSLRCPSPPAHPQISQIMTQAEQTLKNECPEVFDHTKEYP